MERVCKQRQFDPNIPKYFCFCGCHVMTGAKIIASIYSSLVGLWLLVQVFSLVGAGIGAAGLSAAGIVFGIVITIAFYGSILGCLWHGVLHERAGHLVPFMVLTVFEIVGSVLMLVVYLLLLLVVSAATEALQGYPSVARVQGQAFVWVFLICIALIGKIALHIWIFLTMKKTYSFLLHKRFSTIYRCANAPHTYQGYIAVPKEDTPPPAYGGQQSTWKQSIENVI
uniref:Uncharacterized protein n=1 Tax=Plectus sambesii TaxID=2011161 RepID=A0A914X7T6_9BILA